MTFKKITMSGKVRQRGATNPVDSATLSVNERILKECHSLYTDPENGKDCWMVNFINITFLFYFVCLKYFGIVWVRELLTGITSQKFLRWLCDVAFSFANFIAQKM